MTARSTSHQLLLTHPWAWARLQALLGLDVYEQQWCGPSLAGGNTTAGMGRRSGGQASEPTAGYAFVASGTVGLTSMDRAVEYSYGTLDYTFNFIDEEAVYEYGGFEQLWPYEFPAGAELPHVTPNTCNIKLVKDPSTSTY